MKIKTQHSILIGALLLLVGFFGSCISENCSLINNPETREEGERHAVTVSIIDTYVDGAGTRRASESIMNHTPVEFLNGRLFLVNGAGNILQYFNIDPTGGTTQTLPSGERMVTNRIINRPDLESFMVGNSGARGVTIPTVPAAVTRVVIVGNYPNRNNLPTTGHIDNVLNRPLTIFSQFDARDPGVTIHGERPLAPMQARTIDFERNGVTTTYRVFETVRPIHLVPNVARFEISSIEGTGDISAFTLDGIFMDGFFRQARVDGALLGSRIEAGTNPARFLNTAQYYTDDSGFYAIHDWFQTNSVGRVVTPRTVDPALPVLPANRTWVFAYHLFATGYYNPMVPIHSEYNPRLTATVAPPNIVLRFSSVTVRTGNGTYNTITAPRFLTVGSLRHISGVVPIYSGDLSNENVQLIRPSRVYRIPVIEFAYRDLSDRPNDAPINVEVEVDLGEWDTEAIRPGAALRTSHPQPAETCDTHYFDLPEAVGGTWTFVYQWQRRPVGSDPNALNVWQNVGGNQRTILADVNFYYRRRVQSGPYYRYSNEAFVAPVVPTAAFLPYVNVDGVFWSTRNLAAPGAFVAHPADPGMLFQWNRNVGWSTTDPRFSNPAGATWDSAQEIGYVWEDDPCPTGWRVPTHAEFTALIAASRIEISATARGRWLSQAAAHPAGFGCQAGRFFNTYDDNPLHHIFFPAAGHRVENGTLASVGTAGHYWGRERVEIATDTFNPNPIHLYFNSANVVVSEGEIGQRYGAQAMPIRCVKIIGIHQPTLIPERVCPNCVITMSPATNAMTGAPIASGDIEYRWYSTTTPGNPASWTFVDGETGVHLTIPNIQVNTYFRRRAYWISQGIVSYSNYALMSLFERTLPPQPDYLYLSGVYWATRNIHFSHPQAILPNPLSGADFAPHQADIGMYFQWGRPYGWNNSENLAAISRWNPRTNTNEIGAAWETSRVPGTEVLSNVQRTFLGIWAHGSDPCRFVGDGMWRLPTRPEHDMLLTDQNISRTWLSARRAAELGFGCQAGGAYGPANEPYLLFFPAAGTRRPSDGQLIGFVNSIGTNVSYWSSTPFGNVSDQWAQRHHLASPNVHSWGNLDRAYATNIRCVRIREDIVDQGYIPSVWIPYGHSHTFQDIPVYGTGPFTFRWQRAAIHRNWVDVPNAQGGNQANVTTEVFNTVRVNEEQALRGGHTFTAARDRYREGVRRFYRRIATCQTTGRQHISTAQVIIFATSNLSDPAASGTSAFTPAAHNAGSVFQWNRMTAWSATTPVGQPTNWDSAGFTDAERPFNEAAGQYMPLGFQWQFGNPGHSPSNRFTNPCPPGWRVPHYGELLMLGHHTTVKNWTSQGGQTGVRFTNAAGQELFIPAVGQRATNGTLQSQGNAVYLWSSNTHHEADETRYMRVTSGGVEFRSATVGQRAAGRTVRCVMQ